MFSDGFPRAAQPGDQNNKGEHWAPSVPDGHWKSVVTLTPFQRAKKTAMENMEVGVAALV